MNVFFYIHINIHIILVNNEEGLIREVFTDIVKSGDIKDLYHNSKYPIKPDKVSKIQDFDTPENDGENYGQRVRGYFIAPYDGDYIFFSSCDQMCEVYFSMDDKPDHISKIISQVQFSNHNEFDK